MASTYQSEFFQVKCIMVYQTWLRNQARQTGTINGKGAGKSEVRGGGCHRMYVQGHTDIQQGYRQHQG